MHFINTRPSTHRRAHYTKQRANYYINKRKINATGSSRGLCWLRHCVRVYAPGWLRLPGSEKLLWRGSCGIGYLVCHRSQITGHRRHEVRQAPTVPTVPARLGAVTASRRVCNSNKRQYRKTRSRARQCPRSVLDTIPVRNTMTSTS